MAQTILQVEDDEHDVFLLRNAFERQGVTASVQVAHDGQEAIDYLSGKGEFADRFKYPLPQLVLLDVKMPKVNGLEVLKWIRTQPKLKLLVVVIFSSSHLEEDVQPAYELGANCFLVKPSSPQELRQIADMIKLWLRFVRLPRLD